MKPIEKEKTISEFLMDEYRNFAFYTLENRAIPSVVDGFKPVQRKIIQTSSKIWKTGNEKPIKVFQLSGKVASDMWYHHGDASLSGAIINMAQRFKNNAPLFIEDGQFGSRRSPEAGAPRYIGVKLSPFFGMIYKDPELLVLREEEGEKIEPYYFLPLIPMVLVNGGMGISVGFRTDILNRDVIEITECVLKYVKTGKCTAPPPAPLGWTGTFEKHPDQERKWKASGVARKINQTTIRITELPPSMTYEKYEVILDNLIEKKLILSYEDNCRDNIDYTLKFKKGTLDGYSNEELRKILNLDENFTENLNCLDEHGKLIQFERPEQIITYFTDFRLKTYDVKKETIIKKLKKEIHILSQKSLFIKLIINGKLKINNRNKEDIINDLIKFKIEKSDNSYDYLLRLPLISLTKEMYEKSLSEITTKESELKIIENTAPKDMYVNDLKLLLKNLKIYNT
jgi:DNA topoisomerase-2